MLEKFLTLFKKFSFICDCKLNRNLLETVSVMSINEDESDTSEDESEYSLSNETTDKVAESGEQLDNNNLEVS